MAAIGWVLQPIVDEMPNLIAFAFSVLISRKLEHNKGRKAFYAI
jgi:hypothetical protein